MMSFALTESQLMDGSKTVTRRTGWANLKPGTRLQAVRKAMGLKAGERVHVLCEIEVVSVKRITLADIDRADCIAEGFPHHWPGDFTAMFRKHMGVKTQNEDTWLTRIEFRKVPGTDTAPHQSRLDGV